MRFLYSYKTSSNECRNGEIVAANREAAYSALKAQGIRPYRVEEAPGLFNKLFGKGKRWMAIVVLSLLAAALAIALALVENETPSDIEDRAQVYGDAGVIRAASANGWATVFKDPGDRFLAGHAIPGVPCACGSLTKENRAGIVSALAAGRGRRIEMVPGELAEIAKMKRIVNGMRRELDEYLADGGNVEGYMKRLDLRQTAEVGVYERAKRELQRSEDENLWRSRNASLRAMGLPMVSEMGGEKL